MGAAPTKAHKQPTRAQSQEQLRKHIDYVNSVIEAICKSKTGHTFFLLFEPCNDLEGPKFSANIFVHKVRHCKTEPCLSKELLESVHLSGKSLKDQRTELEQKQPAPFAKLGLSEFARFYDRVHLLAPLDGSSPEKDDPTRMETTLKSSTSAEETDSECMICMENAIEVVLPDCNHAFCRKCLDEWTSVSKTCPMCRSHTESNDSLWIMAENPSADQLFASLSEMLLKLQSDNASASN